MLKNILQQNFIYLFFDVLVMKTETLDRARKGQLSPLEAVQILDDEIGGIVKVTWNPGKRAYKIINPQTTVPIPVRGASKKECKILQDLAAIAYWKAKNNGSHNPGEIHISQECSTKHHRQGPNGFNNYLTNLMEKYNDNQYQTIERG